jgi:hypothetical protein
MKGPVHGHRWNDPKGYFKLADEVVLWELPQWGHLARIPHADRPDCWSGVICI